MCALVLVISYSTKIGRQMELDVVFISLCYACQTVQTVDVDHLIVGWDGHLWCVVRKEILLNSNCSWTPLRMKEKKEKKNHFDAVCESHKSHKSHKSRKSHKFKCCMHCT